MLRLQRSDGRRGINRLLGIETFQLDPGGRTAPLLLELHRASQAALAERDQVAAGDLFPERVVIEEVRVQPLRRPAPCDLAGRHRLPLSQGAARPVLARQVRGTARSEDGRVDGRAKLPVRVDHGALRSPARHQAGGFPPNLLATARRLALP